MERQTYCPLCRYYWRHEHRDDVRVYCTQHLILMTDRAARRRKAATA